MKIIKPAIFNGLTKNVVILSFVSMLTDISSEMLYPIIPIFLTSVLGAPMSVIGLIEGVAESAASILKAFSGNLSDMIRRRVPFVTGGYFLSAMGKLFFFFAYSWPVVLVGRFVDRFGKGLRTSPRDALIADSCEAEYRGKAFGFHRAMDSIGALIGPLFAIWILSAMKGDLRPIFLIAFVPAIAAVVMLIFLLKETSTSGPAIKKRALWKFDLKGLSPQFKKLLLVSVLFSIGNSSDAFLIMRAKDIGLTTVTVILAYVVYNFSYSALSLPAGIISDSLSRKNVMIGGYLIFAAVYICFGLYINSLTVWPLFFVYGFYMAMTDGVGKAFVSDVAHSDARGAAIGIYYCFTGLASFLASLIAGLLWTHIGPAAVFIYGAVMALISSILFFILIK